MFFPGKYLQRGKSMTRSLKLSGHWLFIVLGLFLSDTTTRANVYATDLNLNGGLSSITNASAIISYRLNQPATTGCTVSILNGGNVVATILAGTNMGLNSVVWGGTNNAGTKVAPGTYTVSISAGSAGFTNWTQISVDSNSGMPANYPLGIDVDRNTNSPYYGRVVIGNAVLGTSTNFPATANKVGLFKMNADGSQADEGWYGDANYTQDDGGDPTTVGQMPNSEGYNPLKIRIGEDDRIYWCDDSYEGAIIACDMRATTNQIVVNESGYAGNPGLTDLNFGIEGFDVIVQSPSDFSSTILGGSYYGAVFLCDSDTPNWGIWMYHLKNGVADPADTIGTQAVATGHDLYYGSTGGCMVDTNLDLFVGSFLSNAPSYDLMEYANWNAGILPAEAGGTRYTLGTSNGQVKWGYGCGVNTACTTNGSYDAAYDTVINSRTQPTVLASPALVNPPNANGGGIRLFNAQTGAVLYTNIDWGEIYTAAAFDNVGNLYGCSTTYHLWRVWSPPGPNQATTVAVPQIIVPIPFAITGITAAPAGSGCAVVTITFSAPGNFSPSSFSLLGSTNVASGYAVLSGARFTGGLGTYQATVTNCTAEFYQIKGL